ncbi:putative (E)-beta-ocimene synthase [Helianthus anomalus]
MPTLEDYLDNAWRSASGVLILTHGYYLSMNQDEDIDKGKDANAISCYMHKTGVSEEVARGYIKTLIDKAWMKMIKARVACSADLAYPIIDMSINLARVHIVCTNMEMHMELLMIESASQGLLSMKPT